jgi:hypothetical protein
MNEQQKKNYFSLNNDLEYMSPYSSNIKPDSYLTMSDAIKEYTINLDTSKNIMQGIEPEEAGVLGKIGQGVKNWFSNITDLPSNVADSITTSLNGYTSPNMTEEEARNQADEILARINRIKALSCFIGSPEEQLEKQRTFKLLTKSDIKSIELAEDWYALLKSDNTFEVVRAKNEDRKIKDVTILKKA